MHGNFRAKLGGEGMWVRLSSTRVEFGEQLELRKIHSYFDIPKDPCYHAFLKKICSLEGVARVTINKKLTLDQVYFLVIV